MCPGSRGEKNGTARGVRVPLRHVAPRTGQDEDPHQAFAPLETAEIVTSTLLRPHVLPFAKWQGCPCEPQTTARTIMTSHAPCRGPHAMSKRAGRGSRGKGGVRARSSLHARKRDAQPCVRADEACAWASTCRKARTPQRVHRCAVFIPYSPYGGYVNGNVAQHAHRLEVARPAYLYSHQSSNSHVLLDRGLDRGGHRNMYRRRV